MVSITAALRTVKDDLPRMIEHHVATLLNEAADHVWRQRLLDPITTVMLFTMQVMHGNTAINHLRHLAGRTFTAAAYCNARKRLPITLLEVACSPQLDPVLMRVQTARLGKETLDGTTQTAQSGTDHRQAA